MFRRAMAIGAAKSVSFEKKTVLDLKLVYKSVKIKKIRWGHGSNSYDEHVP